MTNGQRTVTTMLAVVAVLLGLNLIVGGSRPAVAQPEIRIFPELPVPEPKVIAGAVLSKDTDTTNVWRFWSDGTVDVSSVIWSRCEPFNACPDPPTVVVP